MQVRFTRNFAVLMSIIVVVGCGNQQVNSTATPNKSNSKTFGETVAQLIAMKNKIRDGFASGDIESAHGPLHEVGDVLDGLLVLAQGADIPADQLASVEEAKETLFDAFGRIDMTLHGGEGSTYEEEEEKIEEAMDFIANLAGVTNDSRPKTNLPAVNDGLPSGSGSTVDVGTVDGEQDEHPRDD